MSFESLQQKLASKQNWITARYNYYEQKKMKSDPSPVIPVKDKWNYNATLSWCTDAVDELANRLTFDGFEDDKFGFDEIFKLNNRDIFFDSAIRSALISACCFVYISADEKGYPRLQVIDGKNATGTLDPITNMLTEGYAILNKDDFGNPTLEAYFTPYETRYYESTEDETSIYSIPNPTGYPLLVPMIYRPDAKRPFGQPRISKALMDIMDKARFCITRSEVCAEFGTIPQKYILGLSPDAEFDTIQNTYKTFLAIDKDSEGDRPTVGQFQQASMEPHLEQLKAYRAEFMASAYMDTPEHLEQLAIKAQSFFNVGLLNVGLTAVCLKDETHYLRQQIYDVNPIWKPVYKIDVNAINQFGDGLIKINQAIPDAFNAKSVQRMTGLPIEVNE